MTTEEFVAAGRGLSSAQVALATFAGWVGLAGLLGTVENVHRFGLSGVFWFVAWLPGALVMAWLLAARLRRRRSLSVAELVRGHAGPAAGLAASLVVAWNYVAWAAAQIAAVGAVAGQLTGLNPARCAAVTTAVMVLYTISGGLRALVKTDVLHAGVMLVTVLAIAPAFAVAAAGGLSSLKTAVAATPHAFSLHAGAGGRTLLLWFLSLAPAAFIDPGALQKVFAAKTERASRRGLVGACTIYFAFGVALAGLGLASRVLQPDVAPVQALPGLMTGVLPAWLGGVVVGLFLAVALSTADTALLVVATTLERDVYALGRPGAGPGESLLVSRVLVVVTGAAALVFALLGGGVVEIVLLGFAIYVPGLLLPVVAASFGWRSPAGVVVVAIAGGATAAALWVVFGDPEVPAIVVGLIVSAVPFALPGARRLFSAARARSRDARGGA